MKITKKELQILGVLGTEMYLSEIVTAVAAARGSASVGAVNCALGNLKDKGLVSSRTDVNKKYRSGHRVYYKRTAEGSAAVTDQQKVA